jgi:TPR repeat protein
MAPLYDYGVLCLPPDQAAARTNPPSRADNGQGEYSLGMGYLNGEGDAKDIAKAYEWLAKAASKGHAGAKEQLRTNLTLVVMAATDTNKPPPKPKTEAAKPDQEKAALAKRLAEIEEELRQFRASATLPASNAPPPAPPPVSKTDEAATLAQLKEAYAALEKRLADSEEELRKLRAPEAPPKTSPFSGRWLWVLGILVVICALWLFSASREREE